MMGGGSKDMGGSSVTGDNGDHMLHISKLILLKI